MYVCTQVSSTPANMSNMVAAAIAGRSPVRDITGRPGTPGMSCLFRSCVTASVPEMVRRRCASSQAPKGRPPIVKFAGELKIGFHPRSVPKHPSQAEFLFAYPIIQKHRYMAYAVDPRVTGSGEAGKHAGEKSRTGRDGRRRRAYSSSYVEASSFLAAVIGRKLPRCLKSSSLTKFFPEEHQQAKRRRVWQTSRPGRRKARRWDSQICFARPHSRSGHGPPAAFSFVSREERHPLRIDIRTPPVAFRVSVSHHRPSSRPER